MILENIFGYFFVDIWYGEKKICENFSCLYKIFWWWDYGFYCSDCV